MKLLLDEMWPPRIAVELRRRGHDAAAIVERPELRGQPDTAIFAFAQTEGRALVTENVMDYRPLATYEVQNGHSHAGLILTSNRRFPRHEPRALGRLITALEKLLSESVELRDREYWLS